LRFFEPPKTRLVFGANAMIVCDILPNARKKGAHAGTRPVTPEGMGEAWER
jgi:hypothetical protein